MEDNDDISEVENHIERFDELIGSRINFSCKWFFMVRSVESDLTIKE